MKQEELQIKNSPEYEDAYQEAIALSEEEIEKYQKRLEEKIAGLLERLQQKEQALNGQLTDSEREVLLAEKSQIERSYDKTMESYEGLRAGFWNNPENIKNRQESEFKKVELAIMEPRGDKGFMITYDCADKISCKLYNLAIKEILTEAKMSPFLQGGGWSEAGWHAWEVWRDTDKQELEILLVEIQKRAELLFENHKSSGIFWE